MLSLSRGAVPLIQGFEDAGDFTVMERLKTSVRANLVFYLIVGAIGLFGFVLLITMNKIRFLPFPLKKLLAL
jgi:hypothetical protein